MNCIKLIAREKFIATNYLDEVFEIEMEFWETDDSDSPYRVLYYEDKQFEFSFHYPFLKCASTAEFFHEFSLWWLSHRCNSCTVVRCPDES